MVFFIFKVGEALVCSYPTSYFTPLRFLKVLCWMDDNSPLVWFGGRNVVVPVPFDWLVECFSEKGKEPQKSNRQDPNPQVQRQQQQQTTTKRQTRESSNDESFLDVCFLIFFFGSFLVPPGGIGSTHTQSFRQANNNTKH